MRHRVKSTRINRPSAELKALLRNLATSIVLHGGIETTETKAKTVQPIVEKLVTTVKTKNEREAIRDLKKVLFTKDASVKMLSDIKKRFEKRSSGFTRIIPIGVRAGDAAPLVRIEFVSEEK